MTLFRLELRQPQILLTGLQKLGHRSMTSQLEDGTVPRPVSFLGESKTLLFKLLVELWIGPPVAICPTFAIRGCTDVGIGAPDEVFHYSH